MKAYLNLPVLVAALALSGCADRAGIEVGKATVESAGLSVGLEIPTSSFVVGESFEIAVTAENKTLKPITIRPDSGARVYVRVWRNTGITWRQVKRYPPTAVVVMRSWQLPPGGRRRFAMELTVEPDWPTGEPLKLTAELNGRDDAAPAAIILVHRRAGGDE